MRILLVTHRFLPQYLAGTEVYTGLLARGLIDRGHLVRIFTGDPAAGKDYSYDWEGLPVQAVPWQKGRRAGPIRTFLASFANPHVDRRFVEIYAEFQPDIVHVQHLMGLSSRLPALSRQLGAGTVITLHDYWFRCSNTMLFRYTNEHCPGPGIGYHCGGCALQRLGRRPNRLAMTLAAPVFVWRTQVLRRALLAAERLVAPSRLAAEPFVGDVRLAGRMRVIPHGLAAAQSARPARRRPDAAPLRFAYVGSIVRSKGIHVIVKAFGALSDRGQQLHLYGDLSADEAYVSELRQLVDRPGVYFHGSAPRDQVLELLRQADLVLVPTLWRETYSVIVDEAFQAGTPVLVSTQSAAAQRVIPEVNGLLAPAGDVAAWHTLLQRVCDEPALLGRLQQGITPPETVAQHTAAIEALYAEVLSVRRHEQPAKA